jgi:hypothetical protein
MTERQLLRKIHKRLAEITIGNSALRNQGAPGFVSITRKYLYEKIKPKDFFERLGDEKKYRKYLDRHTTALSRLYPTDTENWGAARKSLNLFFRELVYNKFLAEQYSIPKNFSKCNKLLSHLEVPLDSHVAEAIIERSDKSLPKWEAIKALKQFESDLYQEEANAIAAREGVARVHLDLVFWRPQA